MIRLILISVMVRFTISANRLINFLGNIPVLKQVVGSRLYGEEALKIVFIVLGALTLVSKKILLRLLLIAFISAFGLLLYQVSTSGGYANFLAGGLSFQLTGLNINNAALYILTSWFLFSFIGGLFSSQTILNPMNHLSDKTMLTCLRTDPALYAKSRIALVKTTDILIYFPLALVLFLLGGIPIWAVPVMLLMYTAFRLLGDVLNLSVFKRTGKHFGLYSLSVPSTVLVLAIAFIAPIYAGLPDWSAVLANPIVPILSIAAILLAWIYIKRYPVFDKILRENLNQNEVALNKAMANSQSTGGVGGLNLYEVKKWHKNLDKVDLSVDKHKHKTGFSYLNAIFFDRHSNYFRKKLLIRCLFILAPALVLGVLSIFWLITRGEINFSDTNIPFNLAPYFFFLTYIASMGKVVTASVFGNCDIQMLHYSYYRTKETTAASFKARFAVILRYNTIISATMAVSALATARLLFGYMDFVPAVIFSALLLCMGVFFAFNDLFLYYVIQPYDSAGSNKSNAYKIINFVIYCIAFANINLQFELIGYSIVVAAATALYLGIGTALMLKVAPTKFRLR